MLGELLVEAGVVAPETLSEALATKGLLGDVLLLAGCLDRDTLERIAEQQFLRRMVHLFACPPETGYAYHDGHIELMDWGGDPAGVDPLSVLWHGLRAHAENSTMMEGALARLGDAPLCVHRAAVLGRFGFDGAAREIVSRIQRCETTLDALVGSGAAPPLLVRRVVYTLLIARQLDLGKGSLPAGAEDLRPAPPSPLALGRLRLRTSAHRLGAAAPDPPGTGERPPIVTARKPGRVGSTTEDRRLAAAESPRVGTPPAEPPESTTALPDLPELLELARTCLEEQDVDAALQASTLAYELAPKDPDALTLLTWIRSHVEGADLEELILELDEVLRDHEQHVEARLGRARLRLRFGDDAGAIRDLRRVLEHCPEHAHARTELAELEGKGAGKPGAFLARLRS
jgi:hypothetical protein